MHIQFHRQSIQQSEPINEAYQQLLACMQGLGSLAQMAEGLQKSSPRQNCLLAW